MPKTKKVETHFEQVPLEMVKKIVEEEMPDNLANGAGAMIKPPAKK